MQAVVFDLSIPKYLAEKALGRWAPSLHYGPFSMLSFQRNWPEPKPRTNEWTKLRTLAAGVCGSDMASIFLKLSPAFEPFSSFPAVFGHEVLARVEEVGSAAWGVRPGDRVAVQPFLGCRARGVSPECPACARGLYCSCRNVAEGPMAPGMICGGCRDAPGGWGEVMAAHASQLFAVPEEIPDRVAVLIEPLSIGMHAVLRRVPEKGAKVLVVGGGMIGYAVVAALRMIGADCEIAHATLLPYQSEMGLALGADEPILGGGAAFEERVRELTGARSYKPMLGKSVFKGGFDHVYDCIGSADSVADSLRSCRERGTAVLVGAAGVLPKVDWTPIWTHELDVLGIVGYGLEDLRGERRETFDLVIEKLRTTTLPLAKLVTHEFALKDYRTAIEANLDRAGTRSIKTIFTYPS